MSEENAPKLRLKPKLAADPGNVPQPPVAIPPAPEPPAAVVDEPKTVRLKPKLAIAPIQTVEQVTPPEPATSPAELPPAIGNLPPPVASDATPISPPAPAPEAEKPVARFSLKPKVTDDAARPEFPPPVPAAVALVPVDGDGPIPAPDIVDPEEQEASSGTAVSRGLTARPFPPPPGNFPAPPAGGLRPAPPWAQAGPPAAPRKSKMVFLGGGVIAVLLVLGGVFFAYKKFTAVPPEPSPRPKVAAKPRNQEASVPAMVAKAKQEAAAPINEILPPAPAVVAGPAAPAKSVATPPAPLAVPGPAVVAPPPPASAPFKAWVENLRIGGVRAGATTRVFIGGTAYAAGELVNPQLGIVFDSYNPETRRLTFKDKTGATVERRN